MWSANWPGFEPDAVPTQGQYPGFSNGIVNGTAAVNALQGPDRGMSFENAMDLLTNPNQRFPQPFPQPLPQPLPQEIVYQRDVMLPGPYQEVAWQGQCQEPMYNPPEIIYQRHAPGAGGDQENIYQQMPADLGCNWSAMPNMPAPMSRVTEASRPAKRARGYRDQNRPDDPKWRVVTGVTASTYCQHGRCINRNSNPR
eukprot:5973098-Pyramimonas_sp.AAC.2